MKPDYDNLSDEELITLLRDGEEQVTDYLMDKYKSLVRQKARSMYILGADNEDLIQEGMIGLFKAVRDYDAGRDASFSTFADLCVLRQMYTAIEASNRKKHMPLNSYISIYAIKDGDDGSEPVIFEALSSLTENNPEELFVNEDNAKRLLESISESLSPFEQQVLNLRLTGMGYVEIARVLGKDEKSTDNALLRIKTKVKRILNE